MANADFNFPNTFVGSQVGSSPWDYLSNYFNDFSGWGEASVGMGIGSAIGDYFSNKEKIKNQQAAYQRSVDTTQRSLMGLLGRGELVGQSDNARVVGRNQPTGMPGNMTGGQSFYDRILAPGTILSGGPGQGGIDPQQIQARTMLARLMSNDPFSGQQMQGMYGEQNRQLGRGLGGPASGNLQQDLQGLMNFGGAGQARAGLGMQLGAAGAQSRRQGALGASQYLGNVYGAAGRTVG